MSTWIGLCAAETAADKENPTAVKRTKMNDFMLDPHLKYCDLLSTKTKVRSSRMSICADCNSFPIGPHLSRSCWEDLIHVSSCSVSGRSIRDGGGWLVFGARYRATLRIPVKRAAARLQQA